MDEGGSAFGLTKNDEIVRSLKACTVVNIERVYNRLTLERYLQSGLLGTPEKVFCEIAGAVLIHLDNGDVVAFSVEPIKNSVVAWFDIYKGEYEYTHYFDREYYSTMSYDDKKYSNKENWTEVVGEKISKITVLKIDKGERVYFDDAQERIVILETSSGNMALSYSIIDVSSHSSFPLTRKSDIPKEVWDIAEVIEL